MSTATPTLIAPAVSAVPNAPRAEKFAKAARKNIVHANPSKDNATTDLAQKAHKRLTASIQGMSVGTERRFLHAIRQFGYGIKPDTRILKDGSASSSADATEAFDSTAGEFALKYLIGQSLKRRRKMLLRKGKTASEVDAMISSNAPETSEGAPTEKLDLRPLSVQKRESRQAAKSLLKEKATKKDAAAPTDGETTDAAAPKKRAAPKRKTPTTDEAPAAPVEKKKDEGEGEGAAAAPKRKRVKVAAPEPAVELAPASVTPARVN